MSCHASLTADLHTSVKVVGPKLSLFPGKLLCMLPQYMCRDLQYSWLQLMASRHHLCAEFCRPRMHHDVEGPVGRCDMVDLKKATLSQSATTLQCQQSL